MADQNFMDLASKTASGIAGTDYMMLVNNSEAYKALVNDVAEAILSKLTSKSFSGLETTAKNVIGALNELNSKIIREVSNINVTNGKITFQIGVPDNYKDAAGLYIISGDYRNQKIFTAVFAFAFAQSEVLLSNANLDPIECSVRPNGNATVSSDKIKEGEQYTIKCLALRPLKY